MIMRFVLVLLFLPFAAHAADLPAPGKEFRDCDTCPPMVVMPLKSFTMGSPDSEKGRTKAEGPQHTVRIAYPLAIAKHEVSFAEWDACVADGGCSGFNPDDEGMGRGQLPVIDVSWDNAQDYVKWLSGKTGQPYRLLSEAEWEDAARAGAKTPYSWGAKASHEHANYGQDECCGSFMSGRDKWELTAPVESFPANAFGLHDMLGNVWEWVEDCWDETHAGAPGDGSVRRGGDCNRHVMRGGSWSSMPSRIRAAYRDAYPPDDRGQFIGFRVARSN
jgi:formylglycine-generating enzyme required for sulfatase activity